MKNSVAVTIGLKYRFDDFEVGTVLKCGDSFYMKTSTPKNPLVSLDNGVMYHWSAVQDMKFELLPLRARVTITVVNKQKIRVHNLYKRVKRPITAALEGI